VAAAAVTVAAVAAVAAAVAVAVAAVAAAAAAETGAGSRVSQTTTAPGDAARGRFAHGEGGEAAVERGVRWCAGVGCVLAALAVGALALGVWNATEGYLRPHLIASRTELWGWTHLRLPPDARFVSGRQMQTPGENQVWAVLEMPRGTARKWLDGPTFQRPESEQEIRTWVEQCWGRGHDWDEWHPEAAGRAIVRLASYKADKRDGYGPREYSAQALADVSGPVARVYLWW
jgi:hypothetical protein